ncbi:MAG: phospholipase [Actinomycetota bacterium]|nr:phospholipase [Actinomycetota bacterium]
MTESETGRPERNELTRRRLLKGSLAAGVAGATLSTGAAALIEKASAATAGPNATLGDIEHVVFLMQENRSFDHYFGTLSGVRGFSDRSPVFNQFGYRPGKGPDPTGSTEPFHLLSNPPVADGQTTNDITHNWAPQHQSWNGGAMDGFVTSHLAADGVKNGLVTMGYFNRGDLAFYYALADAFTICDGYHCSVFGPTDPNRVMSISASIDPAGTHGGPVVETLVANRQAYYGKFTWETMPERLSAAGVSWKVYNDPTGLLELSPFPYFKAYTQPFSLAGLELTNRALVPNYPVSFDIDVATGQLPAVSWIIPPLISCEHPAAPPEWGEYLVSQVLSTLVANPAVWAKTVVFVIYDENGGFFDHVTPPTPPAGTTGEEITVNPLPASVGGIAGPVGLGFRVPCLVLSPLSRGGYVCSDTFDHTSLLRFLETRFGVEVPNLTPWRRSVTGDMTAALGLSRPADTSVPRLPPTSLVGDTSTVEQGVINALAGTADVGVPYPPPTVNAMPSQETTPARPHTPS